MLTTDTEEAMQRVPIESIGLSDAVSNSKKTRLARALGVEWLGQSVASLCWIVSMFTYGISSTGDWLQLMAASAWLVANIASLFANPEV